MTFKPSPLTDVIDWFLTRAGDRRSYQRRPATFPIWWQPNPAAPTRDHAGTGLQISPTGLVFELQEHIPDPEFTLTFQLGTREVCAKVHKVRADTISDHHETWQRYMVEIQAICAEDWDAIVAFVAEQPEVANRRKMQNQTMSEYVDDAYRMLPPNIQAQIVAALVEKGRLELPRGGASPTLKLFYGGLIKHPGEPAAHRFNVHSRRTEADGESVAYDTRFLITEAGDVRLQ